MKDQEIEKEMDDMIYLDNAATTKTAPEVVEAMLPILANCTETHPAFMKLLEKARRSQPQENRLQK